MNNSPLRYPGGKARITPLVEKLMECAGIKYGTYLEPFVGGGGVALALLFKEKVKKIVINDYDLAIYSIWYAILNNTDEFIKKIERAPLTIEEWRHQREIYIANNSEYSLELAFAAFFLNRTNRSGILNAGPIGGYNQAGKYLIDARFNKDKLIEKVQMIARYKERIVLYNYEIREFLTAIVPQYPNNSFIYFDPPYFKKGKELYKNFFEPKDHVDIAQLIHTIDIPWMITYDNFDDVANLYADKFLKRYDISYSVANKGKNSEIIALSANYWPDQAELNKFKLNIR